MVPVCQHPHWRTENWLKKIAKHHIWRKQSGTAMNWKVSPQNTHAEDLVCSVTMYGDRAYKEIKFSEVIRPRADRISVSTRRVPTELKPPLHSYTLKGQGRTSQGGGYLQATKRGLNRNQPSWHLYLGVLTSRTMIVKFLWFKPPAYCIWYGSPNRLIQEPNAKFLISFLITSYFAIISPSIAYVEY